MRSGAEPQPKSKCVYFNFKMWHLVSAILIIFLRINRPNLVHFEPGPSYPMGPRAQGPRAPVAPKRLACIFLLWHYKQNVAIPMVGLNIEWGMAPFISVCKSGVPMLPPTLTLSRGDVVRRRGGGLTSLWRSSTMLQQAERRGRE